MRGVVWVSFLALLAGIGLGLAYSWLVSPARVTEAGPPSLRADFKDLYRSAIAAAYAATGNLPRAEARLSLLGDADPVEALNAQAQRMLSGGQPRRQADQVAALAAVLEQGVRAQAVARPSEGVPVTPAVGLETTAAGNAVGLAGTPGPLESATDISSPTPRATRTTAPTLPAPFALAGQESLCDPNLPDGLLQVMVFNSSSRQLAGAEIIVTWDGGEERFFTGLKPELGNGYADFIMRPDTIYTVQLGAGSDIATGLRAAACQAESGEAHVAAIKLTFQQP